MAKIFSKIVWSAAIQKPKASFAAFTQRPKNIVTKNVFSRGERPAPFSGKSLFEAVLPQEKAVNVACATVSPHSEIPDS
ncbi:MAG: hypothetical protein K6C40_11870 [Thermoguttaceae bacterium]|nr:hypothetical protein [Thermoguttaceae bacterium]